MPRKTSRTTKKTSSVEEKIMELGGVKEEKNTSPMLQVVEVTDEGSIPSETQTVVEEEKEDINVLNELYKTPPSETPPTLGYADITVHKKSLMPVLLWALGILILVVCIGIGIVAISGKNEGMTLFAKPTPTPTTTPTPIATPTPSVDKATITIQVLNGSGIAGAAGTMKTLLEEKGYTVVGTGNARTYDYEKTEIQMKESATSYSGMIEADLAGSYTVGTTSATLQNTLPYDILIIVGKE